MKICAALVLAAAAGMSASAGILIVNGDTTGKPVFNRALAGNPPLGLSGVGTAVAYEVWEIQVDQSANYSFVTEVGTIVDSFMHLYGPGGFNPANALSNVIIGDDDSGPDAGSAFTTSLTAGNSYFVVVSGFANDDIGTYTLNIRGDGNITLVPAPGAMALIGGAGLVAGRRRR